MKRKIFVGLFICLFSLVLFVPISLQAATMKDGNLGVCVGKSVVEGVKDSDKIYTEIGVDPKLKEEDKLVIVEPKTVRVGKETKYIGPKNTKKVKYKVIKGKKKIRVKHTLSKKSHRIKVKGLKKGKAEILCTYGDGNEKIYEITVKK